jgi:hypothetical protein
MSDGELPFGIDPTKLAPSSLQTIDLKSIKRTKAATRKTPFQLHKEEKERKRKVEKGSIQLD